jgi:hypothetical protein
MVSASVRGDPLFAIQPYTLNLKSTSKLVFLGKEDVQASIIKNLSYLPKTKEISIEMPSLIEMIRDLDVNYTKPLYTEVYGKIMVPEKFFNEIENDK